MKIYIAGHRGLVGSSIEKKLKEKKDAEVILKSSKELDLRRQQDTENFFENEKPEQVYLAAAKVGGILANNTYKAEFIYDNLSIALNVINASYKAGVKKLLNLGSSCIYPKFARQPMNEACLLTGVLEPTNEPYAIAKISAIKLCRYYNEQYGTNYISAMPTNLYGPKDNFNLETAHVLPSLMRKFHLAKLIRNNDFENIIKDIQKIPIGFKLNNEINLKDEKSIVNCLNKIGVTKDFVLLWGTGEPYREFLFVDDLAEACVFLMEKLDFKEIGEFVNVGTGMDIQLKDLANLMKNVVGFDGDIKLDSTKPDGTPKKLLDISKIEKLGWHPKVNLEEGLKKTYEWYLTN